MTMPNAEDAILIDMADRIAVVRLNRPSVLNAVDANLRAALTRGAADPGCQRCGRCDRADRQRHARVLRRTGPG